MEEEKKEEKTEEVKKEEEKVPEAPLPNQEIKRLTKMSSIQIFFIKMKKSKGGRPKRDPKEDVGGRGEVEY